MIPSRTWFPSTLQDRAAWFNQFATQFTNVGTSLGFVQTDKDAVQADADMVAFLAATSVLVNAYQDATREFRTTVTEGDIGDPTPAYPSGISPTPPAPVPTGIFERLDSIVKRIRVAPAYTDEIGALLGIIPSKGSDLVETEMKPVLKASSMPGSVVEVTFTRGKSDGVLIETKVDNAAAWSSSGNYFKSPASLNIPDGTGLPHSVQIRARYIIGNAPVGLNSDTVNVVTTP